MTESRKVRGQVFKKKKKKKGLTNKKRTTPRPPYPSTLGPPARGISSTGSNGASTITTRIGRNRAGDGEVAKPEGIESDVPFVRR